MLARALAATLILQLIVFLTHDLVPLGRWNNLPALRTAVPLGRSIRGAFLNGALGLLALYFFHISSLTHTSNALTWLIVVQGSLVYGEVRWWWYPYLIGASPALVARLRPNWQDTLAFLPERNGIRPNALHTLMHGLTFAALVLAIILKTA
jgi:hypothetical protein